MAMAPKMSNDFDWEVTNQKRLYHSVDKAIEIITEHPRAVENIDPSTWKGNQVNGNYYIRFSGGPWNMYKTQKVPNQPDTTFPILIGVRNGAQFLLDGAHRLVRAKMDKCATIECVRLTEAETIQCVIDGSEALAEQAFLGPFAP